MMQPRPRIQIGISCTNLPTNIIGTYAKLSVAHGGTLHEKYVTETEIIYDNTAPVFTTRLNLEYFFEEQQIITVDVFRCTKKTKEDSELLGFAQCTVGRVIHVGGQLEIRLQRENQKSDLTEDSIMPDTPSVVVCIRENPFSKENIYLKLQGFHLDKKDFFGKSDPYVTIYRRNDRGKLQKTYRSEVIKNTLFPDFRPILICLDRLCGGNIESELCFRCYDWDGAHGDSEEVDTELDDLIGEFTTTAEEILNSGENGINYKLVNPGKKKRKKYYQDSGQLNVRLCFAQSKYSFLDYIFGGTSINVVVGVDLSNHANTSQQLSTSRQIERAQSCNEYRVAIQAVMEILQEYDSDQLFPAFGFGSRVSSGGKLSQKYPLSGDATNCFCKGMNGVLEAYRKSLQAVHFSGPVCFAPLIREVNDTAKQNKDENYYVLLILTNGTVDDWIDTKKAVIEASFLPISIIVIGVGGGKFSDMEILDQDFGLLKVGQEQAWRDNVQFVEMRRFLRMAADGSNNLRWSKVGLAKEVLAELPSQITDYFERKQLTPCHLIPGQPTSLKDLCNPDWWRTFTQPMWFGNTNTDSGIYHVPSTSNSSESTSIPSTDLCLQDSKTIRISRNTSNPVMLSCANHSSATRRNSMSSKSKNEQSDSSIELESGQPKRIVNQRSIITGGSFGPTVDEDSLSSTRIKRQWSFRPSDRGT